ncbi:MAG TPA: hypothetical protein VHY37_12590, partial [Tepidisphaeraceae bacterium]|nr:hypothetical protein [Tepidisphaeraceae bacterium]
MLLTTTLPRGGLQVVQPAEAPEGLVKAYSAGFDADDKMSWRAITNHAAVRMRDAWADQSLENSPYARELLGPRRLSFGVAFPLKEPVMGGYPGSLHLLRSEHTGDFRGEDIDKAQKIIGELTRSMPSRRNQHKAAPRQRPAVYLSVMDRHFHDQLGVE